VLGRPEPLVKQGTELMQGLLSEMFGLPAPEALESMRDSMQEVVEENMEEANGETEQEVETDPEVETEPESESESEVELHDYMDIEAHEHPETDSDAYDDNDNSSEQSDDSMATSYKRKRTPRQKKQEREPIKAKRERTLREKRDKAREERQALYTRFGLTVQETEETGENQNDTHEEERREAKRQKRNNDQPTVLRQTTLNFDKVRKNRRLFSRKELSQSGVFDGKEEAEQEQEGIEKPDVVTRAWYRMNSKRGSRVAPGYRYQLHKRVSPGGLLPRRRTGR
jgi:hypothetical protein